MESRVSIGSFAAAVHLSVKTLRHYHQVGLLEPSEVDPSSGYRYYSYEADPRRAGDPTAPQPRHACRRGEGCSGRA